MANSTDTVPAWRKAVSAAAASALALSLLPAVAAPQAAWAAGTPKPGDDGFLNTNGQITEVYAPVAETQNEAKLVFANISDAEHVANGSIDWTIPQTVEHGGTTYTVTQIGYDAKYADGAADGNNSNGTTVFGSDVVSGSHAHSEIHKLGSISIPQTVTEVGSGAFTCAWYAKSVSFGGKEQSALKTIGGYAFNQLGNKIDSTSVELPAKLESIGNLAFRYSPFEEITIPASVSTLGTSLFEQCTKLEKLTFEPNSKLTEIPSTFLSQGGTTLKEIDFGGNAFASIPAGMFNKATLSKIEGLNARSIPANAFASAAVTSVAIGPDTSDIASSAFNSCAQLETIDVDESNATYKSHSGAVFKKTDNSLYFVPYGIKYLDIPAETPNLLNQQLMSHRSLETVVIHKNDEVEFGNRMFYNCENLKTVVLAGDVTSLKANESYTLSSGKKNNPIFYVANTSTSRAKSVSLVFTGDTSKLASIEDEDYALAASDGYLNAAVGGVYVKDISKVSEALKGWCGNPPKRDADKNENFTKELKQLADTSDVKASVSEAPVYDGTAQTPAVNVATSEGGALAENTYSVSYEDNVDAGTGHAVITGLCEYWGLQTTADFAIAKRPVTVTGLAAKSKAGDGTTAAAIDVSGAKLEAAAEGGEEQAADGGEQAADGGGQAAPADAGAAARGVLAADAGRVGVASAAGAFADAAPGTGKKVAVTAVALSGERAGNYEADLDATNAACALSADIAASDSDGVSGGTAGKSYTQGAGTASAASYRVESAAAKTVAYAGAKTGAKKSAAVPDTVKINGVTYKVTSVGAGAFSGTRATSVTVGKNVTSIAKGAFRGSKVTKVAFKSAAKPSKKTYKKGMFAGSKVKAVKVPKKVKKAFKKLLTKKYTGTKAKKLKVS